MMKSAVLIVFASLLAVFPVLAGDDPCAQPSPAEMAKELGIILPKSPWHVVNLWWDFEKPVENFQSLEMDITIDRDVPATYNLYLSPCGIAQINGLQFYGGLQTNIAGWVSDANRERVHPGKGAIFSRWSSDKKTPISLQHVKTAGPDCLVESAGYEGEFASVRRPYPWTKGTYTWSVTKGETEIVDGQPATWFHCRVKDHAKPEAVFEVGSLRFEGRDFTFWPKHSAFIEVYSSPKIPRSNIPKVNVTFGRPRLNGQKVALKKASVIYPNTGPASPDCAKARAEGENCVVEVGPIFRRDESERRQELMLGQAAGSSR